MTMSEESIPLMTSYRSPHNGRRSFAMTSDVPRYSAQVYNAVLRRNRISFTIGQIILFLMLQFEAVRSVARFGEAPCDIFIIVFHVFFEDAGFYVFAGIEINYFCHGASCAGFHISFIILWVHIKMKKYIISLIREQILSVPWYNNKSDYGTAIFIFYVINEMYGYN